MSAHVPAREEQSALLIADPALLEQRTLWEVLRRDYPHLCSTIAFPLQIEFLGRMQKQEQDDAWYTCINYVSVSGKPLYGFVPTPGPATGHDSSRTLWLKQVRLHFISMAVISVASILACSLSRQGLLHNHHLKRHAHAMLHLL